MDISKPPYMNSYSNQSRLVNKNAISGNAKISLTMYKNAIQANSTCRELEKNCAQMRKRIKYFCIKSTINSHNLS